MKKALIAMSGGVDSSVAAVFMKDKGYDPIGVTMKLYDNDDISLDTEKTCCSLSDVEDARNVAIKVGFPYYVFNFKARFKEKVMDKFCNFYMCGKTPNPCIDCNRYLKFDELHRRAKELGCELVVTGHYARIRYDETTDSYQLLTGLDESKDQSYVLYHMTQDLLAETDFPLGEFTKDEIRAKAEEYGLAIADKKESQDICFVPDGDYASFLEDFTGQHVGEGDFVDIEGNVIGTHKGYYHYTVGQRRGVQVKGREGRNYVVEVRPETNQVVIGDNEDLFKNSLVADDFNWISGHAPTEPIKVSARTRYHQKLTSAIATVMEDGNVQVKFDEPVRAMTKGQAVVLYDGEVVLGGGTIIEVKNI